MRSFGVYLEEHPEITCVVVLECFLKKAGELGDPVVLWNKGVSWSRRHNGWVGVTQFMIKVADVVGVHRSAAGKAVGLEQEDPLMHI